MKSLAEINLKVKIEIFYRIKSIKKSCQIGAEKKVNRPPLVQANENSVPLPNKIKWLKVMVYTETRTIINNHM